MTDQLAATTTSLFTVSASKVIVSPAALIVKVALSASSVPSVFEAGVLMTPFKGEIYFKKKEIPVSP